MLISPELMVGLGLRKILYREASFFSAWRKESLKFGLRQIRRSFWHICAPTVKCFFTYPVIRAPLSPKKMVIQNKIRKTFFSPPWCHSATQWCVILVTCRAAGFIFSFVLFFLIPHWLPKKKVTTQLNQRSDLSLSTECAPSFTVQPDRLVTLLDLLLIKERKKFNDCNGV